MSAISRAESAIIVKSRKAASQAERSADEKAAPAAPRKAAELALNVSLPLEKISQIINQYEYHFKAKGTALVVVKYDGTLTLEDVALSSSDNPQFPLRADARFKLVTTISPRKKPVKLNGDATIDFGVEVGPDWCPVLTFGKSSIKFADSAVVPQEKSISDFPDFVATYFLGNQLENVTCDVFKKELAKLWGPVTLPVTAAGKTLYLKLDPQSLSVSRFALSKDRLSFSLSLGALTTVLAKAPAPKKSKLTGVKSIGLRPPAAATEVDATLSLPIGLELR